MNKNCDQHSHSHHNANCGHSHNLASKPFSLKSKLLALIAFFASILVMYFMIFPNSQIEKGFAVGEITKVVSFDQVDSGLFIENNYVYEVVLNNGEEVLADYTAIGGKDNFDFKIGDQVVINIVNQIAEGNPYQITDKYRLDILVFLLVILIGTACVFAGWNAIFSFLGLVFSVVVLIFFIVKGILAGYNPLLITIIGSFLIATVSVYLGHGFNKKTSIAILGILSTLTFTGLLAILFVNLGGFLGLGSEEAFFLQLDSGIQINLAGILLAGIVIGTLGVLDDITTAQVAVVNELKLANPNLNDTELYIRAVRVGKEHITALINTLVLAYAGASMPLFILFVQDGIQPVWSLLNGEFVAEEILRTLAGSIALVVSVPLTTFLAVKFLKNVK